MAGAEEAARHRDLGTTCHASVRIKYSDISHGPPRPGRRLEGFATARSASSFNRARSASLKAPAARRHTSLPRRDRLSAEKPPHFLERAVSAKGLVPGRRPTRE